MLSPIHAARRGEPSNQSLVMFKALLLQRWYQLSDPGLEEALCDRLSFRRFAGLALEDDTPDHSTIFRFREQLVARALMAPLLAELTRPLVRAEGHTSELQSLMRTPYAVFCL